MATESQAESQECSICFGPLESVQVFNCGHTVCGACVSKLSDACPFCRRGKKPPADYSSCSPSVHSCHTCSLPLDPSTLLVNVVCAAKGFGSLFACGHAYCKDHIKLRPPCKCFALDVSFDHPLPTSSVFTKDFSPAREIVDYDEAADPSEVTCPRCFRHGCTYCPRWKDHSVVHQRNFFLFPLRHEKESFLPRHLPLLARLVCVRGFDIGKPFAVFDLLPDYNKKVRIFQVRMESLCLQVGDVLSSPERPTYQESPRFKPFFDKRRDYSSSSFWGSSDLDSDSEDDSDEKLTWSFTLHFKSLHPAFRAALSEAASSKPLCVLDLVFAQGYLCMVPPYRRSTHCGTVSVSPGLRYLKFLDSS